MKYFMYVSVLIHLGLAGLVQWSAQLPSMKMRSNLKSNLKGNDLTTKQNEKRQPSLHQKASSVIFDPISASPSHSSSTTKHPKAAIETMPKKVEPKPKEASNISKTPRPSETKITPASDSPITKKPKMPHQSKSALSKASETKTEAVIARKAKPERMPHKTMPKKKSPPREIKATRANEFKKAKPSAKSAKASEIIVEEIQTNLRQPTTLVKATPVEHKAGKLLKAHRVPRKSSSKASLKTSSGNNQKEIDSWGPLFSNPPSQHLLGRYIHPVYPQKSIALSEEGSVLVGLEVTEGSLNLIKILRSSGHKSLDRAALKAIKGWRFLPGTEISFVQKVTFNLH